MYAAISWVYSTGWLSSIADQLDAQAQPAAGPTPSLRYCNGSDGNVKTHTAIVSLRCFACLRRAEKLTTFY
jgi:hypothetical protein